MKEIQRIKKLFEDLYDGDPWIDVTLLGTLKNISAEQAVKRIASERNSIWQICNHIISWRENVLQRVQGKIMHSPENNYFTDIHDTSETAWQQTFQRLERSQKQWISLLENFDESEFDTIYPPNNRSYYANIQGIIQHDAYHLGQIVLLSKLV